MTTFSPLQKQRLHYQPQLPKALAQISTLSVKQAASPHFNEELRPLFPHTFDKPIIEFLPATTKKVALLKVGVFFSGGQAAGGHNVITGLFDALMHLNQNSQLIGFLNGPQGLVDGQWIAITKEFVDAYRNQGGFHMIGSGRTKIETEEQFLAAKKTVQKLDLDGLVVIGGDDSNTNAAFLAEYFKANGIKTSVVGVPKTIDGDLQNESIEISFGFDSAAKTYSEIIGNLASDALSAKKYYFFVKVMGRSASHLALECTLRTHPNLTLISEEIANNNVQLNQVVHEIADLICLRAKHKKNYGVILIPEGIIEFIPEFKKLIAELNQIPVNDKDVAAHLSPQSLTLYHSLPSTIQSQLFLDRDPHGNVQVSKIETELLLIHLVEKELKQRAVKGEYEGKFTSQPFFCGYEGRSCLPSDFDANYCYSLGYLACALINEKMTGYMACLQHLHLPVADWKARGVPLISMMQLENRNGKSKAVIAKSLVNLNGAPFQLFNQKRKTWLLEDQYLNPGPIQFFGPKELVESVPFILLA